MSAVAALSPSGADTGDLPRGCTFEPDDWRINKQFQMMKFDGARWVLFGPIITDDFVAN